MRELSMSELELVSGGYNTYDLGWTDPVTPPGGGGGDSGWGDWGWGDWGDYGDGGGGGGGGGGVAEGDADDEPPPPPDEASIDVNVNFERELTAEEQAAINKLTDVKTDLINKFNAIDDKKILTLRDGSTVTGAELKQLWSKADFYINEAGTTYRNGTTQGEADLNGGDPKISFNIDTVTGYAAHPGGIVYMVLHEIGHLTAAGQDHHNNRMPDSEQVANDIARGIAHEFGMPILSNPDGGGYSTGSPIPFTTPPATGGEGSGGVGGGGGSGGIGGGGGHANHH